MCMDSGHPRTISMYVKYARKEKASEKVCNNAGIYLLTSPIVTSDQLSTSCGSWKSDMADFNDKC